MSDDEKKGYNIGGDVSGTIVQFGDHNKATVNMSDQTRQDIIKLLDDLRVQIQQANISAGAKQVLAEQVVPQMQEAMKAPDPEARTDRRAEEHEPEPAGDGHQRRTRGGHRREPGQDCRRRRHRHQVRGAVRGRAAVEEEPATWAQRCPEAGRQSRGSAATTDNGQRTTTSPQRDQRHRDQRSHDANVLGQREVFLQQHSRQNDRACRVQRRQHGGDIEASVLRGRDIKRVGA